MNNETRSTEQQTKRTDRWGDTSRRQYKFETEDNSYAGLWAGLAGLGAGFLAMSFLDPARGGRRRALLGDKFASAGRRLPDAVGVTARDVSNRARGAWAEATRLFSSDQPSDQVVEARIRSQIGRVISHPHAVHVTSQNGSVTLDGVILAREMPRSEERRVGQESSV